MKRRSILQRLTDGGAVLLLPAAGLLIALICLLYPGGKEQESENVKNVMATLPVPAVTAQPVPARETVIPTVMLPESERSAAAEEEAKEAEEEETVLPLYFIWPVSGMLERGYDSQTLSYDATMADWRSHRGWDIAAGLGGHVLAAADGTVGAIYEDPLYGTTVEIEHGEGVVSVYANLAAEPTVSVGQTVQVGDVIGAVGESALCEVGEGFHLHFAMKLNGENADPALWLPER